MKFNLDIDDIKYLKILYKDNNGQPALIKTALKKIDDKTIITCAKNDKEDFNIKTPQEVTLSIICQDGLYRTTTKIKSCSYEHPYLFIFLETPDGLEYQQNREYFRVLADFNCSYYVNYEDCSRNFNVKTYDISANGVSILLPCHAVSENDSEIDMMIDDRIVHAKIRYVRSEKFDDGYKVSFTYTDISTQDRDCISKACIKKQLENKRSMNS